MNIDQSFQAFKNQGYKTGYKIKLDGDEKYNDYRITSKIIKFDENNQCDFAMTKPMPVGSIKDKSPLWAEFNLLMEKVSLDPLDICMLLALSLITKKQQIVR